jgi:hypothetical protein
VVVVDMNLTGWQLSLVRGCTGSHVLAHNHPISDSNAGEEFCLLMMYC